MRRRRRPNREIAFSFDSFLDLVANVVGIILRLILVVWVGARSYEYVVEPKKTEPIIETPSEIEPEEKIEIVDIPIEKWKQQLEATIERVQKTAQALKESQRKLQAKRQEKSKIEKQKKSDVKSLFALKERQQALAKEQADLEKQMKNVMSRRTQGDALLQGLLKNRKELRKQLSALDNLSVERKVMRYQVPIAELVQSEELQFECKAGRVSFLDVAALLRQIEQGLYGTADRLRQQWRIEKETNPVGAFRLKYVIIREKGLLDQFVASTSPDRDSNFRYGVQRWEAVPMKELRGESLTLALKEKSEFREIVDLLDPKTTAITFWVYPDSFPMYRKLRDYCVKKGILVAGRPLPMDVPIASSRDGSASRGQ